MRIVVVIPFEDAQSNTAVWAFEEKAIDFHLHRERAMRCTTAFAAMELKAYLCRVIEDAEVVFASKRDTDEFCIELHISDQLGCTDSYTLELYAWGIRIEGQSRAGLLYGAYEFLKMQGVRWYSPGCNGEYLPPVLPRVVIPKAAIKSDPSMPLARGFDFEGVSKESSELLLWMARNRLNLCGLRNNTAPLAGKLGMKCATGGHIFESMLDPGRQLPNGSTLWDAHQDWYGLPANGQRQKESAQTTQFCVTRISLREYVANELIELLRGEWSQADIIYLWGFDTWGSNCHCSDCAKLGNNSDQMLYFLSFLRSALNKSLQMGMLSHNVLLGMCAYEGTATIQGPQNPIPENLIQSGDFVSYYPINRCYAHDIADPSCKCNSNYLQALESWTTLDPSISVWVGEYYNVSRFEDLPLLFTKRISNDLKTYHEHGVCGMTYMHIPIFNWGVRTLTQNLYAQKCWNANFKTESLLFEYFSNWYGPYQGGMQDVYELLNRAWLYISDWRAWSNYSVLSNLKRWDGAKPQNPLFVDPAGNHFTSSEQAIKIGHESISMLRKAMGIIDEIRERDKIENAKTAVSNNPVAVNPVEARKSEQVGQYEMRIGEDRRLLIYGIDSLTMLVRLVEYHCALYKGDEAAAKTCWNSIEQLACTLDSYYVPIEFEFAVAGLVSKDALTRTQVRELLRRCRKYRLEKVFKLGSL